MELQAEHKQTGSVWTIEVNKPLKKFLNVLQDFAWYPFKKAAEQGAIDAEKDLKAKRA